MAIARIGIGGFYPKKNFKDYSFWERSSIFGGFIITPEPGIGTGFSFDIASKISLNLGGYLLFTDEKDPDFDETQQVDNVSNALETAVKTGLFTGISIKI